MNKHKLIIFFLVLVNVVYSKEFYDVYRVKKGDTLNLREKIGYNSKIIEKIPYDYKFIVTAGNKKKIGNSIWIELKYKNKIGWANSYYLKQSQGILFEENLFCLGTEPFWSIDIREGDLSFNDLGEEKSEFLITNINLSKNHTNKWEIIAESKKGKINAILMHTEKCSDDMSDDLYIYEILFSNKKEKLFLSGCCNKK